MVTKFFLINQSNEHVETARQCAWLICLADLPAWLVIRTLHVLFFPAFVLREE